MTTGFLNQWTLPNVVSKVKHNVRCWASSAKYTRSAGRHNWHLSSASMAFSARRWNSAKGKVHGKSCRAGKPLHNGFRLSVFIKQKCANTMCFCSEQMAENKRKYLGMNIVFLTILSTSFLCYLCITSQTQIKGLVFILSASVSRHRFRVSFDCEATV